MQTAADGPRLDDAEEFALSPTFERPKFETIEIPRPDEEENADNPPRPPTVKPAATTASAPPAADAGMVELFPIHGAPPPVAAATTRPAPTNTAAQPTAVPSPSAFNPQQVGSKLREGVAAMFPTGSMPGGPGSMSGVPGGNSTTGPVRIRKHADSYGDELWSAPTDTSRPAFERGPFVVGIVEFLFYPGTLVRWLSLTALAAIPIAVLEMASATVSEFDGTLFTASGLVLLFFAACLGIPWLAVFGAHAMAIVRDTARGRDAIEEWPLGGVIPHGNPLYLPIAFVVGSLPGLLVFILYYLSREEASIRGPLMLLVSAMLFTPLVWLPMVLEKSFQGPLFSQTFWQSFRYSGNGWIVFYFEVLLLSLFAAGGMALWNYGSVVLAPLSALFLVTPLFLYFRLVGRLLWYIDPEMAPPPPPPKAGPAPLPETVDPTQYRR